SVHRSEGPATVPTSARIAARMWSGSVGQAATSAASSASAGCPPSPCSLVTASGTAPGGDLRCNLLLELGFRTRKRGTGDPVVAGSSPVVLARKQRTCDDFPLGFRLGNSVPCHVCLLF